MSDYSTDSSYHPERSELFDECLIELQKMKNIVFFKSLSMYDTLKIQKQSKKLITLARNKDLVDAFNSYWRKPTNRTSLPIFGGREF